MKKTFIHPDFTVTFTDERGYFSLTGDINAGSGAVGDKVAEIYPALKPLADIHLADCETGAPMHAWGNGIYHFEAAYHDCFVKKHGRKPNKKRYASTLGYCMKSRDCLESAFKALADYWRLPYSEIPETLISTGIPSVPSVFLTIEHWHKTVAIPTWAKQAAEAYKLAESLPKKLPIGDGYVDYFMGFTSPEKARAIADHVGVGPEYIVDTEWGDGERLVVSGIEYLVLTDEEATEAWENSISDYIDETVINEIPVQYQRFFDRAGFIEWAKSDGRGHSLYGYDGKEIAVTDPETGKRFFAYRQ